MKNKSSFLFLPVAFTIFLIALRVFYSGNSNYVFLIWNLLLAVIPFLISTYLFTCRGKLLQLILFFTWLLFLPNALYILTDLVHLKPRHSVPLWFDSILIFSAAIDGLIFAYASLLYVEKFLNLYFNHKISTIILIITLLLSSFGVYAGRFLRWNSWDLFQNPWYIIGETANHFLDPFHHPRTWGVTFILFSFFAIVYYLIKKYPLKKV